MIELKIEDKIYKMASDWSEVTIDKYIKIQEIEDKTQNMKFFVSIVSILSDCPLELLYTINIDDFTMIDLSWIGKDVDKEIKKIVEINGVRYGVVKDMKKLTLGEYTDLDYYIQKPNENIHLILAVLMRPVIQEDGDLYIIEKYNIETLEARAELFKRNMNVVQLTSVSDFFLNGVLGYTRNTKTSSL